MAEIPKSSVGKNFETFVLGDPKIAQEVEKNLAALTFLNFRKNTDVLKKRETDHFVIALCDFSSLRNTLVVSRALSRIDNPLAHKLIFATAPFQLRLEDLIFAFEVGVHYTVFGSGKENNLRNYLKKYALGLATKAEFEGMEETLKKAYQKGDKNIIKRTTLRLNSMGKDNPQVLKHLAIVCQLSQQYKKSIYHLKSLVEINPQDTWAIGQLLTNYARLNEANAGLKAIEEITDFRVIEGLEKSEFDILDNLPMRPFSPSLLDLLKNRAAIAITAAQPEEALYFLLLALRGMNKKNNESQTSELHYQLGTLYTRLENYSSAVFHFEQSIKLSAGFKKARYSLDRVKNLLAKQDGAEKKNSDISNINLSSNITNREDQSLYEIEIE